MRICYVAPDVIIPHYSGASTHVIELAKALVSLGADVHVICRRKAGQTRDEVVSGVSVHRLFRGILGILPRGKDGGNVSELQNETGSVASLYSIYLRTAFAIYAGLEAVRVMKTNRLEVIIERETAFGAGALAATVTGKPMVLEQIGPRFSSLSMEKSSRIFSYSESMVPNWARAKTTYVNAAVDTNLFHPDSEAGARVRKRYGIRREVLVGYVGTFQRWHGVQDLLKAAQDLVHDVPDIRLLLVGGAGRWVRDLADELGLSPRVIFTGPIPYPDVPDFINACDVLVAPYNVKGSEREDSGIGSPLKVLEYMACGKTTVGTSLPQLEHLIRNGSNGLLFPPGNIEALSESVRQLARNSELRERIGKVALATVRNEFTWDFLADQIVSSLREALEA